jgi:hypothetical protein
MNSVDMPLLLIEDNGFKEADRMNKIMIVFEFISNLITNLDGG